MITQRNCKRVRFGVAGFLAVAVFGLLIGHLPAPRAYMLLVPLAVIVALSGAVFTPQRIWSSLAWAVCSPLVGFLFAAAIDLIWAFAVAKRSFYIPSPLDFLLVTPVLKYIQWNLWSITLMLVVFCIVELRSS